MKLSIITGLAFAAGIIAAPQPALQNRNPEVGLSLAGPELGLALQRRAGGVADLIAGIIVQLDQTVTGNVNSISMSKPPIPPKIISCYIGRV